VNLLLTCCNYMISTRFHSLYLIQFVVWLYLSLNSHFCNTCGISQKKTSCRSLTTYLSRYLHGVNLGFMLSFCANSISFVFKHFSIFAFIGFHDLNIPFYSFIIFMILSRIPPTQSHVVPAGNRTICLLFLSLPTLTLT
jgi:hypothetical protein